MTILRLRSSTDVRVLPVGVLLGVLLAAAWLTCPAPAHGDWVETYVFDPGDLTISEVRGYHELRLPACVVDAPEGAPRLPVYLATFPVPEGETVTGVEVVGLVSETLPGPYEPLPGGAEIPGAPVQKDERIWASTTPYPSGVATLGSEGFMGGARLASLVLHPVQVVPASGSVLFHREIRVRVLTRTSSATGLRHERAPLFGESLGRRIHLGPAGRVKGVGLGDAPKGALESGVFQPTEYPSLDGSLVEYLIITGDELASEFQRLADWKTSCGVPAAVKTVSWIQANYPGGVDLPEKIRMFIQDAYQKWGTEWVLLGGDVEFVPVRLAHIDYYSPGDWLISCDMYYECLDGNWNADGDHLFGEGYKNGADTGDSADFYPDVFVGRASVEDITEAAAFIDNTMAYREDPTPGYLTSALFLGEVVFPVGWDPGDPIYLDGADICEQSAQWVPSDWDTVKLYEIRGNENHDSILAEMTAGHGVVCVVNHGDAFKMSCSDDSYLYMADMDSLGNLGKMGFIYASNCNLSQVELDCFNEHLMQSQDRGYIGCIGATRFCFPHAARDFQEEVFRLMFATGVRRMGQFHALHKVPFIPIAGIDNSAHRWTVLSYILLGDPELPLWMVEPQSLNVTHSGSMALGDSTYSVSVTSGGSPVEGLTVCLWKQDTGEYARGLTDAGGQIELPFEPGSPGSASLVVIGDDYIPYETAVAISGSGRVYVSEVVVDDTSGGNGDGRWDGGEQVDLDITLHNGTSQPVENITAALGLVDGGTATIDLTVNGASDPQLLSLGSGRAHPASLPATYSISDETLLGRPTYTAGAPPDTGVYFWLDHNGWHVRAAGGFEDGAVWVSVSTDGQTMDAEPFELEGTDSLWVGPQELQLFSVMDTTECEDGVNAVFGDTLGLTVVTAGASYGTLNAGQSQTQSFTVGSLASVPDGVPVYLVLDLTSGGQTWTEWVRVDHHGPRLSEYYHGIDDSTYTGNGNAKAEVGETVVLRSSILNRGSGTAPGVTAVLRSLSGVDISDSTDVIGDVGPGDILDASGGFVFTCLSPSMLLSLELTDSKGRRWVESFELAPPAAPTGLLAVPAPDRIEIRWDASAETDLVGYHVYRADGERSYQRITTLLDEGTAYHCDHGLLPEHHYVYRVTAVDTSGNESAPSTPLDAWSAAPYMSGFPVSSLNQFFSSPVVGDIDADNDLEIVIGSKDGNVYAWHHTGDLVSGWPKDTGGEVWSSPSLVQLDDDPELEVLSGTWNLGVYAWNHDGSGVLSPNGLFASTPNRVRSCPVCQDVDFDGRVEVFAGCSNGKVYAWNHDGTGYINPDGVFASLPSGEVASSPAIADVDDDGALEIFVGSLNGNFYGWNRDGTGYINPDGLFAAIGASIWSSPSIGDLDNNGDLEIVVGCHNDSVYAWHHDGNAMANWPRGTQGEVWSSPALGDLDHDGDLEIVIGSYDYDYYAWHHDGSGVVGSLGKLGYTDAKIWGSAALADIDENGLPDIVGGSLDGYLYAWDGGGHLLPGWPVATWDGIYGSPAVADLDLDGDLDVVCASYDGMLYVYDLGATENPDRMDWPMFRHDAFRTGYYGFVGIADVESDGALEIICTGLDQNVPNPFNPETRIAYRVGSARNVNLAVYDVMGRWVETLASGPHPAGVYRVTWRGRNSAGQPVASGVYFCRLEVGREVYSTKMVLLK